MASQPRQFTIEKQDYRGAVPDGLAPVPMPEGLTGQAAAAGFDALAKKFSAWADQDAKFEGERDAKVAAASNDFTRTGAATIYGRARDATALDLQVQSVTATFRNRTLALFDQHRNNPEALRGALEAEARDHAAALPAEAQAGFRTRASDIGVVLQRQAIVNQNSMRESEARATLIRRTAETERHQSQLLSVGPADPEAEKAARAAADDEVTHIRGLVADGLMDPAAGEKLVMETMQRAEGRIIQARAGTLRTPEEIAAYRNHLRAEFQAGRLPGLTDIAPVEAELDKLARARGVEMERQTRALQTSLDDALTRAARGQQPTAAEMAVLEAEAAKLGPRGTAALETMRSRMVLAQRIAGLPIADQERVARELEAQTRAASTDVSSLPAGMRNNNPGNIKYVRGLHSRYEGVVGPSRNTDQGDPQAVFASPEAGMRAAYLLARRKYDGGLRTAAQLIAAQGVGWTPGNMAAAGNIARMAGVGVDDDLGLSDPARAARFMRALFNQEHGEGPARAYSDAMIAAAISGAPLPPPRGPGAITRAGAENVQWMREQVAANRNAMNADMLGYAADRGLAGGDITVVDMNAAPDQLAAQMRARVDQVDAVAPRLGKADPSYLRPDDKAALQGVVNAGGERALATVEAIVRGGGRRATQILKEIGGDAPALAHAAAIGASTGDRSFARTIAEGLAARQVQGARPAKPNGDEMATAERNALGASLRGMRTDERERTQAAVGLWFEVEAARRGIDPKQDPTRAQSLLEEGFRRARGETRQGDHTYGGVTTWRSPAWFGGSVEVQVPPSVRQDRFGDVLKAITTEDLAGLANPPVMPNGNPMDAAALRRMQPIFGPGGYRWAMPPDASGNRRPVLGRDGQPFVLDLEALTPALRQRLPDAFR